jgi:hypothetical protein
MRTKFILMCIASIVAKKENLVFFISDGMTT